MPHLSYVSVNQDTFLYDRPRNFFLEAVWNVAKVIEDVLLDGRPEARFGRPFLKKVYRGALFFKPAFPCCDVRFVRALPLVDQDEAGSDAVLRPWAIDVSVRYLHSVLDPQVQDADVTRNLWRIASVLMWKRGLNGWVPNSGTRILGVSQDVAVFGELDDAGFVAGGAVVVRAFVQINSSFDDGIHDRIVEPPSGPEY